MVTLCDLGDLLSCPCCFQFVRLTVVVIRGYHVFLRVIGLVLCWSTSAMITVPSVCGVSLMLGLLLLVTIDRSCSLLKLPRLPLTSIKHIPILMVLARLGTFHWRAALMTAYSSASVRCISVPWTSSRVDVWMLSFLDLPVVTLLVG